MAIQLTLEEWRSFLKAMPAANEEMPFGPEFLVYKVEGKMFGVLAWQREPMSMNLKCEPNWAEVLRMEYPAVTAGYHMNKRHWNTVVLDGSIDDGLIKDWIRASYDLIYLALPKKTQAEMRAKNDVFD